MRSRSVAAFIVLLSTLALFGACNGQGEGDVCDPHNGNGDCRNGYQCVPTHLGVEHGDRCCPADPALVTTAACGLNQGASTDASSAAPVDASSADGATGDGDSGAADGTLGDDASTDGPTLDGASTDGTSPDGAAADGASPSDAATDGG